MEAGLEGGPVIAVTRVHLGTSGVDEAARRRDSVMDWP